MSEQEQLEQYNEMRRDEARQDEFEMSNLAKLRSLVPQGDGYNSEWAEIISCAADELYELKITNMELAARYKALAEWIYSLGMPGVEIYKHELSAAAADALDSILKIDACVNACARVSTTDLEQYANWKDQNEIALDNAERRIKELEPLAELGAKMVELTTVFDGNPIPLNEKCKRIPTLWREAIEDNEARITQLEAQREELYSTMRVLACLGNGNKYGNKDTE